MNEGVSSPTQRALEQVIREVKKKNPHEIIPYSLV